MVGTTTRRDESRELRSRSEGPRGAFERLVAPHHAAALALAARLLGSHDDAEDAVQDALFKAYRKIPDLADTAGFRGWFLRIVFNQCVDAVRRTHEHAARSKVAPPTAERASDRDALRRVREVMAELPAKQQAALHLRVFEEMAYGEIATIVGLTPRSARVYVVKARRYLRERLATELEDR